MYLILKQQESITKQNILRRSEQLLLRTMKSLRVELKTYVKPLKPIPESVEQFTEGSFTMLTIRISRGMMHRETAF